MHHFFGAITNKKGDALTGYFVQLLDASNNVVSIYSDNSATPIINVSGKANMALVDSDGNASFYVNPGTYTFNIYASDAVSLYKSISNIAMGLTTITLAAGSSVSSRTALSNISLPVNQQTAYLAESGREGMFVFSTANLSSQVTADPSQNNYVAPSSDTTGASGAWVRVQDSQLVSSNGAGLVGFIDDGTGATATTIQSFLRNINQLANGSFFAPSAKVQRLNYRALVGDATKNAATNVASQPDWLTTFQLARGRANGSIQSAQMAVTNGTLTIDASNAFVAAAQNAPLGTNYNAVALTGIGVSNNGGVGSGLAWGLYAEGYRYGTGSNGAYGIEADAINFVSAVTIDPFTQSALQTVALQAASGGEYSAGLFSASAALSIRKNGADFLSGIIFGSDAIKLTSGLGEAIAFGTGHVMQWYASAGQKTSKIYSNGTTPGSSLDLKFTDGNASFMDAGSGQSVFMAQRNASGVNFLAAYNNSTGNSPGISAYGSDTNIDIQFNPQGTGLVKFGTWVSGTPTLNGYITIKDSGGTVRKLGTVA